MSYETGLRGPVVEPKNEWEIEYKTLKGQLKDKKVITDEIWQERVNPLIPPDGIVEEDLEIIQYLGFQKQKEEAGKKIDQRAKDISNFKASRKNIVYKESDFLTVKILPSKRPPKKDSISKLKKSLKIKKIDSN